jgi:hypothetical protein
MTMSSMRSGVQKQTEAANAMEAATQHVQQEAMRELI